MIIGLVVLSGLASATTIHSELQVDTIGNEKATMSHYSYLKDPSLNGKVGDINGGVKGLKTGAFNYLVNGKINFDDQLDYYDGQIDIPKELIPPNAVIYSDTAVYHALNLSFDGEKGISEFYGSGFFPNNKVLSAWKKIRYDDIGGYDLGQSHMASKISVDAYADMGRGGGVKQTNNDYDFNWDAYVQDAVVDVKDSMGLSNITKGHRVVWEQEAQIQGSDHITNSLYANGLFIPGAGQADWLPCICDVQDYVNQAVLYGYDWPNINQQMIFSCAYPGNSSIKSLPGGGYSLVPAAGGSYNVLGSKFWYYEPKAPAY